MNDVAVAALVLEPWVALLFLAWGIAEATAQPIVPDAGLGFLALATPLALGWPMVSAIAGGVVGAILLVGLARRAPDLVERMLRAQPGLGRDGRADARARVARRGWRAFAQIGPGLPLKAYIVTWLEAHDNGLPTLVGLALVNRLTRIVPVVAAFAMVGIVARPLQIPIAIVLVAYVGGWIGFYAAFWSRRRSPRQPDATL
jgi:hypothetical protein